MEKPENTHFECLTLAFIDIDIYASKLDNMKIAFLTYRNPWVSSKHMAGSEPHVDPGFFQKICWGLESFSSFNSYYILLYSILNMGSVKLDRERMRRHEKTCHTSSPKRRNEPWELKVAVSFINYNCNCIVVVQFEAQKHIGEY